MHGRGTQPCVESCPVALTGEGATCQSPSVKHKADSAEHPWTSYLYFLLSHEVTIQVGCDLISP